MNFLHPKNQGHSNYVSPLVVLYFGKPYSFSHVAALKRFGKKEKYFSKETIEDAINSIKQNSVAVVPIENTYGGMITGTIDAFANGSCAGKTILEELEMKIELYLIGKDAAHIRKIYSHAYPLKVSEEWIKKNAPNAKVESVASTSEAVIKISNEKYSCAIASKEAAEHYGLDVLDKISMEGKNNLTKFFVVGLNP
jgi:chorismate mutase/prephenate dehydratase